MFHEDDLEHIARDVRILRDRTLKEHAALHPIARMIMNVALDSTMRSAKVSLGGGHGGPKGGGGAVPLGRIAGADVAGCIAGAGLVLRIAFSVESGVLGGLIGGISASIATWW